MNTRAMYVLAGFVFGLTLLAVVVLRLNEQPVDDIITLAGPVITGLFVVGILGRQVEETKAKVDVVEKQTNGVLEEKFARHAAAAAHQALVKAGVASPSDPEQLPVGTPATPPSTSTMPADFLGAGESAK